MIPEGVAVIGDWAFLASGVSQVIIPESVIHIGLWAFYNCDNLTSVTIPGSVAFLDDDPFNSCDNLEKIQFLGDAPFLSDYLTEGTVYRFSGAKGWSSFFGGRPVVMITLPDGLPDAKEYKLWVLENGWRNDFSDVSADLFEAAYLVDEEPLVGQGTRLAVSSFAVGSDQITVGLHLAVSGYDKEGVINGCLVIEGLAALGGECVPMAYLPFADGKASFTGGQALAAFDKPVGFSLFRARIQKNEPLLGENIILHIIE